MREFIYSFIFLRGDKEKMNKCSCKISMRDRKKERKKEKKEKRRKRMGEERTPREDEREIY